MVNLFRNVLSLSVHAAFFALLCNQFFNSLHKYKEGKMSMTTTIVRSEENLTLPSITVCFDNFEWGSLGDVGGAHVDVFSGCVIICCGIAHIYVCYTDVLTEQMICRLADQTFFVLFLFIKFPTAAYSNILYTEHMRNIVTQPENT